jgi:hypothetical protein
LGHDVEQATQALDATCGNEDPHPGYLYAIRPAVGGLTKIGRASDPARRITDIQAMSPVRLILVGLSHQEHLETHLHTGYRGGRAHGEWFKIDRQRNPLGRPEEMCWGCQYLIDMRERIRILDEEAP